MFLIEKTIIFDSAQRRLSDKKREVSLNENMSRCLWVLASRPGEIISKEELIHQVWEMQGVVVSETSVRQTLSQLRKAFAQFNLAQDVILTVPRKGYKLLHAEPVRALQPVVVPEGEPAVEIQQQESVLGVPFASQPAPLAASPVATRPFWKHPRYILLLLLSVVLVIFTVGYLQQKMFITSVRYLPLAERPNIYVQQSISSNTEYVKQAVAGFERYVDAGYIILPVSWRLYISNVREKDNFAFIICQEPKPSEPHQCQSVIILRTGR